jgi:hypothetical protein
MRVFDLLRSLVGRPVVPARPRCRLTEEEAIEIARQALERDTPLYVQDVVQTEKGVEWLIGTATIGSGVAIRLSDESGKVVDCRRWGIR